jgi:bacterioferritin (cytochrome b1)
MQVDPHIIALLQESLNMEASLALRYFAYQLDASRFGLSIADGLGKLGDQCEVYEKELAGRILFLESTPTIAPSPAQPADSLTEMLESLRQAETAAIVRYAEMTVAFWDLKDMPNFHYFQHLSKWHAMGDDGKQGHMSWIQKQQWQLQRVGGEAQYIAEKI